MRLMQMSGKARWFASCVLICLMVILLYVKRQNMVSWPPALYAYNLSNAITSTPAKGQTEHLNTSQPTKPSPVNSKSKSATGRLKPVFIGRLGNCIFGYSAAYATARKLGMKLVLGKDDYVNKVFKGLQAEIIADFPKNAVKHQEALPDRPRYYKQVETIDPSRDTYMKGYWCTPKYFSPTYDKEIRDQLVFRDEFANESRSFIESIKKKFKKPVTLIGVHIRRGDFLLKQRIFYGFLTATPSYFAKAMAFFKNKYNDSVFIVCSDDLKWTKANIKTSNYDVFFSERHSAEVDLAILSYCHHTIMSVGTYGWWASFISGGETIYYKHQLQNGSEYSKVVEITDFPQPEWIGMD